ncbi:MAG: hypothetical protein JNM56_11680 [Planctomycetia bacterium]|nr:hypothetical protein [Planctomycetia bacterium]
MSARRIAVNHPGWEKLQRLHQEAIQLFPHPYLDRGFGAVGLILHEVGRGRYEGCTPGNCHPFAGTGGNGVHFSFLALGDEIDERSPVVVSVPAMGGYSAVVGESLHDFLCLGAVRGYFALEQLAYNDELTMRVYTDPAWQPTEKVHDSVGYTVNDHQQQILEFLTRQFDLRPWCDRQRFKQLENEFQSRLAPPLEAP